MDPLQMLQLLMGQQQGGFPTTPPRTPIPPDGLPPVEPPAPAKPAGDEGMSEFAKLLRSMQAEQEVPRKSAPGGAATLNPFYNPNSPGMGTETFTKMAAAMGGK